VKTAAVWCFLLAVMPACSGKAELLATSRDLSPIDAGVASTAEAADAGDGAE
jgi:hypothetical protein